MADSEEPIVLGSTEAVLQGIRRRASPWEGEQRTVVHEGPHAAIEAFEQLLVASGYDVSTDYTSPKARLEYTESSADGTNTGSGETWELRGNDISKQLASHTQWDGLESQINTVDQIINGVHPTYKSDADKSGIEKYVEAKSPAALISKYIGLRSRGVTSYLEAGYRIVHTVTTSSKSTQQASFSNVMEVTSPPVPTSAKFNLPNGEWLKKAPQVYDVGKGKFKITQEWVWAEKWAEALYQGGTWEPEVN